MRIIEGHDYDFPVVGYNQKDRTAENIVTPRNVYGTAFQIGGNYFLTAGHSIANAQSENDTVGVAMVEGKYMSYESASTEIFREFDIGIIKTIAAPIRAQSHRWLTSRLPSLFDVVTSGFPHAQDPERNTIGSRSFKGHIVSLCPHSFEGRDIKVYELSFQCPVGLSGAALITNENSPQIAGIIVGNHSTEMLVFSHREVLTEPNRETQVDTVHALQLGIAVQNTQLFDIESELLGGTVRNHLEKHSLLGGAIM